jgi:glycosyltransferase involved in cell wall biosynthesis
VKILYHHRTMGDGAEGIHIQEMVSAFRELGHEVRVVSLIGEKTNAKTAQADRWKRLRGFIPSALYEFAELSYNVFGGRRVAQAIREFEPDVVYDRYNSYNTAAVGAAKRAGVPLMLEVNSPVAYERVAYENLQLKMPWLARRYERHICNSADHVFVVSTPLKRHLVDQVGVPAGRITVLPNGANPRTFDPRTDGDPIRARHGISNRIVIGFVGILRPWHGMEMLLDAFTELCGKHDNLHLLVVGDGPIQDDLKAQALATGVADRVTFTGRLSHTEVRDHVAAFDIAVSPKATFYASPMKILEYMAMAKPVIAPAMDNIRDIIDDRRTGILFEEGSVSNLRDALDRLARDEGLRRTLGLAARAEIDADRNWRTLARRVTRIVENVRPDVSVR